MTRLHLDDLATLCGQLPMQLDDSRTFVVDQARIVQFADATEDRQWIHVDPVRAAHGPFGATIAHGFLTLSLLSAALEDMLEVDGVTTVINYGLDRVRFPSPLPAGSRARATGELIRVRAVPGGCQVIVGLALRADTADRPACVADWVIRYLGVAA